MYRYKTMHLVRTAGSVSGALRWSGPLGSSARVPSVCCRTPPLLESRSLSSLTPVSVRSKNHPRKQWPAGERSGWGHGFRRARTMFQHFLWWWYSRATITQETNDCCCRTPASNLDTVMPLLSYCYLAVHFAADNAACLPVSLQDEPSVGILLICWSTTHMVRC